MQPKKGVFHEKTDATASAETTASDDATAEGKPKRGRPKTSPHDPKTQGLMRVRNHRARLKAAGVEKVETYLPKTWHRFLQETGEPIQQLGAEAFALLLRERGAGNLVETAKPFTVPSKED